MEINQLIEKAQDFFTKEEFESFTKHLLNDPYSVAEEMLNVSAKKENESDLDDNTAILEVIESVLATVDELIVNENRTAGIEELIESLLTENNVHIWQLPFREPVFIPAVSLQLLRHKHGEPIVRTLIGYLKEEAEKKTFEDVTDFPILREFAG